MKHNINPEQYTLPSLIFSQILDRIIGSLEIDRVLGPSAITLPKTLLEISEQTPKRDLRAISCPSLFYIVDFAFFLSFVMKTHLQQELQLNLLQIIDDQFLKRFINKQFKGKLHLIKQSIVLFYTVDYLIIRMPRNIN